MSTSINEHEISYNKVIIYRNVKCVIKHILDLTFYGYLNTYMAGITLFFSSKKWLHWIRHTSNQIKQLRVQVSILLIAKYLAIIRLSVTGCGHLEFSHENVVEKREPVLSVL